MHKVSKGSLTGVLDRKGWSDKSLRKIATFWSEEERGRTRTRSSGAGISSHEPRRVTSDENHKRSLVATHDGGRKLIIAGLPPGTGAAGVLSQMCGGPLELVSFQDGVVPSMEVTYMYHQDLERFYRYAASDLFRVNDRVVHAKWVTEEPTTHYPKWVVREVQSTRPRRVLVMSKVVAGKPMRLPNVMHYPKAKTHISLDFDIDAARHDFRKYGEIIEVGAMVSRRLTFSVHFADVHLAVMAKRDIETSGTHLHSTYGNWTCLYGRDPADRPTFIL